MVYPGILYFDSDLKLEVLACLLLCGSFAYPLSVQSWNDALSGLRIRDVLCLQKILFPNNKRKFYYHIFQKKEKKEKFFAFRRKYQLPFRDVGRKIIISIYGQSGKSTCYKMRFLADTAQRHF